MAVAVVLMAGGGGTRFWPRSRQARPKQFLALAGEQSLVQLAYARLEGITDPDQVWVITSAAHRSLASAHLPQIPGEQIVGEPCGRDTAACLALGTLLAARRQPDTVVVATPADHIIEPVQQFRRAIQSACQVAQECPRALITLGIAPSSPATGYGYIQRGELLSRRLGLGVYRVRAFREKPPLELAREYVASGQYYWNSGIFVWQAQALVAELQRQQPALLAGISEIVRVWDTPARAEVFGRVYAELPRISIDYAIMEGCQECLVIEAPFVWDDVGSWQALERLHPQDAQGNTVLATHCGLDTHDCIIVGEPGRLIATSGIQHLLIVQDGNATLVADKRDETAVKKLVEYLQSRRMDEYL
ncbi:MAG: mannose-1-phosphate guanylyltransferase [Gemmataceae bacterium]